jgi:uridine kinase
MKICFTICGLHRCIDLVINKIDELFSSHDINYYICLTKNNKEYEKEYNNYIDIDSIISNKNIIKLLFVTDLENSLYGNSLNYTSKINNILSIINDKYDLYILIRSDFIFNSINFLENIHDDNKIYLCNNNNINKFIDNITTRYNDNIIITKSYINFIKLNNLHELIKIDNNYLEIILYNYIKINSIEYEQIFIDYKIILSRCNIIAIAGDSGSGKTTLLNQLTKLFPNNYLQLETDRYHKWERGNTNYLEFSHLNPKANNLDKMNMDVFNLKIGHEIYAVDYNHSTGKFTQEEKIESKNNIILCGLHTLYNNMNNIINLKIFMDTDRELIKKWKINRDVIERGYNLDKVLKQIEFREKDYEVYIKNQKENADIIIKYYEITNIFKCEMIIKSILFINKLILNKKDIINDFIVEDDNIKILFEDNIFENIIRIINIILL